jgi:hypothetical protein
MRELWRKTTALFWENPILWLPLVCADLLVFCFTRLQKLLTRQLIDSLLLNHPALTGHAIRPVAQPALLAKAALLSGAFVWGTHFLNICLYTVALVITATLVQELQPDSPGVLHPLGSRIRRILVFSGELLALYALSGVLLLQATRLAEKWRFSTTDLVPGFVMLAYVSVAYCMAPSGIRLLREAQSRPVTSENFAMGRSFAILMVMTSLAISYFLAIVEQSLNTSPLLARGILRIMMEVPASAVTALPYVPLFISLALIATNDAAEVTQTPMSPSSANCVIS